MGYTKEGWKKENTQQSNHLHKSLFFSALDIELVPKTLVGRKRKRGKSYSIHLSKHSSIWFPSKCQWTIGNNSNELVFDKFFSRYVISSGMKISPITFSGHVMFNPKLLQRSLTDRNKNDTYIYQTLEPHSWEWKNSSIGIKFCKIQTCNLKLALPFNHYVFSQQMTMPLKNALDPTIGHYCAKAKGAHGLGQPTLGQAWALKHV